MGFGKDLCMPVQGHIGWGKGPCHYKEKKREKWFWGWGFLGWKLFVFFFCGFLCFIIVFFSVCFPFLVLTFLFYFVCMFGVCFFCVILCVRVCFLVVPLVGVKPFPFAAVWLQARQLTTCHAWHHMHSNTHTMQHSTHTQSKTAHTHTKQQHPHKHRQTLQTQPACSCSCWWSWKRLVLEKTWSWKRLVLEKTRQLPAGVQQGQKLQERSQGPEAVVCHRTGRPLFP